jgi:hypothetical protein
VTSMIRGVVIAEETPLAFAPLVFGTLQVTANPAGEFNVIVPALQDASIASGLTALRVLDFNGEETERLEGTGKQIEEFASSRGGDLRVNVLSRIQPENICRTFSLQDGSELLRFPYTNRYGEQLEVQSQGLNTLYSASGGPAPTAVFEPSTPSMPDGYFGFEWPISDFVWVNVAGEEQVSAVWKILGKQSQVDARVVDLPMCEWSAGLDGCIPLPTDLSNRIFLKAVSTVTSLSKAIVRERRLGVWRPEGQVRAPFFDRAAKSLRSLRAILSALPQHRYICPSGAPPRCTTVKFPKQALLKGFDSMLRVQWPRGLERIPKLYPKERKAFLAELRKQPDSYVWCDMH